MAKVTFAPNVPHQLALKNSQGKMVSGRWGDQMRYTLTDGRLMSVNMDVASKINLLEIDADEPFCICKRWNGQRGQPVQWDVWRAPEAEKARAAVETAAAEPDLETLLRESIAQARKSSSGSNSEPASASGSARDPDSGQSAGFSTEAGETVAPAPGNENGTAQDTPVSAVQRVQPSWAQVLQFQTEALTDVYAASIKYASTHHGNAVKSEDVRALMTTAFINLAQRGRSRVA